MAKVLWAGKLTPSMMLLTNFNSVLAFAQGRARNTSEMKKRVKDGYEAAFSDHVHGYDEYGGAIMAKAAEAELEGVETAGKEVLDVGCGTGILTFLALAHGARKVVGGDVSKFMLSEARAKAAAQKLGPDRVEFTEMDAESLPLPDGSFDLVLSSLTLGMVPDQQKAISEMGRVTGPGGRVVVGVHGSEYLWEAQDAAFRAAPRQFMMAYRPEFWPLTKRRAERLFGRAGLQDVVVRELRWKNHFASGAAAWDFYAAISGCWWYERLPVDERIKDAGRLRDTFERRGVRELTEHIVVASGWKP